MRHKVHRSEIVGEPASRSGMRARNPALPVVVDLDLQRNGAQAAQPEYLSRDETESSEDLSTVELVALETPSMPLSLERVCKRALDVAGALVLATVFLPLILGIFLAMGRSAGSAIFEHRRVGRNGREFGCLKFRTMVPDAERVLAALLASDPAKRAEWDRDQKLRDDPRVTRVGKFLRRTSLDELPQLWNVLKNEMSLVGPRPVTQGELVRYGRSKAIYLTAKPGITGLWQVSGRSNTDFRRRVAIDVCYLRNQGVLLDLWILLKTALVVIRRQGAY